MGWFDEQIKQRKKRDGEVFLDSFLNIAGAVTGKRVTLDTDNYKKITQDAIDEILRFYHVRSREVPDHISNLEEQLEYLMRPHGIMRRTVLLEKNWHKDGIGALLGARKDDGNVVALIPSGLSGYKFYDIVSGTYLPVNETTQEMLEDRAICFYKPFPLEKLTVSKLVSYVAETVEASDLVAAVLVTLAATLMGVFLPKLNRILFSDVLMSRDFEFLAVLIFFTACVTVSSILFSSANKLIAERVTMKMNLFIEAATMMRILSLPADFFKRYGAGELAAHAQYIGILCDRIVTSVISIGLGLLFSPIYLFQIYVYAPSLLNIVLMILGGSVLLSISSTVLQIRVSRQQLEFATKEGGMSYAMISGIQKIKLAGAEKRAFARWANLYAKGAEFYYNPPLFLKINGALHLAVTSFGMILLYYTAIKTRLDVADYYAFYTAYAMVSGVFLTLGTAILSVAKITPAIEIASPILEVLPEVSQGKEVITRLSGTIELNRVSFRYKETTPNILDDFSLKISSGQYVAIVGASGCGKSTLMRLMLGFERPQKGAIYYDGKDMNTIDLRSLRKKIGVVLQDAKLFQGDIHSNIAASCSDITLEEVWEAAELAGIADDIRSMPMGMKTLISEGSGGISGGQRQRLVIARAIASKPKIFLLDEATSALDNITQKKISEALSRFRCTRIVIAHRLSTIKDCDRIIVLDQGRIVEDGTYEKLIEKKGFFAELIERQTIC